jgi:hypothetical protein
MSLVCRIVFNKNDVTLEEIETNCSHINEPELDMKRFYDIFNMKVYEWMVNPFTANVAEIKTKCH